MGIIKSAVLEKLQPAIAKAVSTIQKAIEERRPIVIRHHCDADGYCAGISLERAIMPMLSDKHTRERDLFYYYTRLPLLAPSYTYGDATKDLQRAGKFGKKMPLIIILDTGSGADSLAGIEKVRIYGASVIVVDHHPADKGMNKYLDAHVNPYHAGSTYDFCAGMLCAEIAYIIDKKQDFSFIASVAAVADKVASKESEKYISLAQKNGSPLKLINRTAAAVDFEAYATGPTSGGEMIDDLLGADAKKQYKLLTIIEEQIKPMLEAQLQSCLKYAVAESKKNFDFVIINIQNVKHRNSFPARGKSCGIVLDHLMQKGKKAIVIGVGNDSINFRCSTVIEKFDVNEIIAKCKKKFPYAQVCGGGHRVAGTMNFIPASYDEIFEFVKDYVDKL
ncbi:hypothetical protein COV16_05135 [Candidatus Woesearchaeota archaeon CG10_big_fil_rev_8_21_14_0_10_34_8]|nr:MAG: hypothetical protein COV16_05135 [Candidatus Woesearchaeota archaeon CG10_big_fil_rev_8_21_14_0_10_34_8]